MDGLRRHWAWMERDLVRSEMELTNPDPTDHCKGPGKDKRDGEKKAGKGVGKD